jgi:deoxyribodipyrimidine photo-lyase
MNFQTGAKYTIQTNIIFSQNERRFICCGIKHYSHFRGYDCMYAVVWYKRDLRISDHEPLKAAIESGLPIIPVFLVEPTQEVQPEFHERHRDFQLQCAAELQLSIPLQIMYRDALPTFKSILGKYPVSKVYSYAETGVAWTYQRDISVRRWLEAKGVDWIEFPYAGVQRGRSNRHKWDEQWRETMTRPLAIPDLTHAKWAVDKPGTFLPEKLIINPNSMYQTGGYHIAQQRLHEFLHQGIYRSYQAHISKPVESRSSCSRLSPYLAWGAISLREVYQTSMRVYQSDAPGKRALQAFISRLHWHCHFIQKFEMEDRMEFENLNRGFNAIRTEVNDEFVRRWKEGSTGIPMIDASMRCVNATGYLNFRMRAMLVSFLTHNLWQPWQTGVHHLARMFLDFEPGIHFPQFQMQAGTTGINQFRIYNPVKQGLDHDVRAVFVRKWVPEIAHLPETLIHTPWKMTPIERAWTPFDYPEPVVDIEQAARKARDTLFDFQKHSDEVKRENLRILLRHTTAVRKIAQRTKIITSS